MTSCNLKPCSHLNVWQVPGNIRRAEHFVQFLKRFLHYMRRRMGTQAVEQETPVAFLAKLQEAMAIDGAPHSQLRL